MATLPQTILQTTIQWAGAIAAIVLVFFLIKDGIAVAKGEKSIGSVVFKVLCIFIIIGIMFAAGSFESFGNMFKSVFEGVVTEENLPNIGQQK